MRPLFFGSAAMFCALLRASASAAQGEPETLLPEAITVSASAAQHAAIGDFAEAAAALERAAPSLSAAPRAIALAQAALLRDALGDREGTARDLQETLALAATEPDARLRAWTLVERLGARCERGAPAVDSTSPDAPEALSRREHLRDCLRLYRDAATLLGDAAPVDVRIGVRIATARVERALGDLVAARSLTREAIALYRARWPDDPARDVGLDGADPYAAELAARRREAARLRRLERSTSTGVSGIVGPWGETLEGLTLCDAPRDGMSPASERARACDAVAEGRLGLALDALNWLDAPMPRAPPSVSLSREAYDAWARRALNSWVDERMFRLGWLAGPLSAVVNPGSAVHAPAAYAVIAQAYAVFAAETRRADQAPDVRQSPELLEAYDRQIDPGSAFENVGTQGYTRCRSAAIAARSPTWVRHCQARLNAIDGARFPLEDEITPSLRAGGSAD